MTDPPDARAATTLPTPLPARILLLGSGELGRELTISLKRLEARPIATLSLEAQERHERNERVFRDD